jgi:hypothetical protein
MNIGKWYDPISERWIVPRQMPPVAACAQPDVQLVPETRDREAQRIWDLLVDCCAGE